MQIHGPYSDDTWNWLPEAWEKADEKPIAVNRFPQVIWDLGVLLAVPLVSAAIVCLFLKTAGIY